MRPFAAAFFPVTGLYDHQGVLRFTGRDQADCLAYADLFGMEAGTYSLSSLPDGQVPMTLRRQRWQSNRSDFLAA
jgi:hypothetical protein